MAGPKRTKRNRRRVGLILAALLIMGAAAAIAYADQIVPDADTVTAGDQSNQTLSATKGATLTPQTSFTLRCNGNNHVDNGETVSLTFLAVGGSGSSIPAGVGASLSATGASLGPVSSAWPDDGTGCSTPTPQTLGDNGNSVVTIGAPNALGGPYAYTVKWSQSNLDDLSGNGPQVTYNVNVNPRPPSNFNATANGNSEIDLSWTASPDAADITDYKIVRTKTSGGATTTLTAAKTATTLNDTGLADSSEYCYTIRARYNDGTTDFFSTSVGPACATTATAVADADSDGIPDSADNCPNDPNTDQANRDGDGFGDVCDDNSFAPALGTAAADQSGNEGSALTTSGSFTDGDGNSTLTISKMSGNGTVTDNGDGTWSWSYTPTDNGGASVTVKASDGEHADATDTFNWSAANVPPTATLGNNGPKGEGTAATVSFSAQSDASSDDTAAGFHYAYSCTNGSLASATYDNSGTSDSTSCTYFDNGTYTVKARIIDKDDGYTEYTTDVSVTNVAPAITSAAFTSPASCGANNATLHVVFGDPGTLDTWTAKVDWNNDGDYADAGEDIGSVTSPFDASHTFNGGVHAVKVQVTDDDGDSSNQPTASVTVNYNLSSILQPINDTGHGQNPSVFKYGSTIPVKVEVTDCDGSHPTNLVLYVKYTKTSGATPPGDTEVVPTSQADSGNQMRYSDPLYVLQLSSKAITNDSSSGYTLFVNIQSTNQSTQANIGFK